MRILIRSIEGFLKSRVVWMVIEWVARFLSIRQRCGPDHAKLVICDHTIDITYIRLGTRFIYLAVVLDGYTRSVRGWAVSLQVDQALTVTALQRGLRHGHPHFFHSDQGAQYAAYEHTELLYRHGVRISMSERGRPTQNAFVERFIRTLKEEHVNYAEYADLDDAQRQLQQWLEVEYMTQRIHSALGYLTPAEFEADARLQLNPPLAMV